MKISQVTLVVAGGPPLGRPQVKYCGDLPHHPRVDVMLIIIQHITVANNMRMLMRLPVLRKFKRYSSFGDRDCYLREIS